MSIPKAQRPSAATILAAAALAVAMIAAVLAVEQPASATNAFTIGPYVADVGVHDVTGDPISLVEGDVKSATAECPPGQVLVAGGYESHGAISKLGSVVSVTSSHPEGSFTYKVPLSNGLETTETQGPRSWTITAVDPGLSQPVAVEPYATCLELKLLVTVTSH